MVLVAAHGLSLVQSAGAALTCGLLTAVASLVAEHGAHGFSCCMACGIFLDQE